jgi:hypothetical protein
MVTLSQGPQINTRATFLVKKEPRAVQGEKSLQGQWQELKSALAPHKTVMSTIPVIIHV